MRSIDAATRETVTLPAFLLVPPRDAARQFECFWTATSRPSARAERRGLDVYLTLVDRSMRPVVPEADTLTVRTTCTNRNLPARLPFGNEDGDFELERTRRSSASWRSASRLAAAAEDRQEPPCGSLVSHLSLNYLSLVSEGREALAADPAAIRLHRLRPSPRG